MFFTYATFLSPRGPLAFAITDDEPAIYYNAKLWLDNRPFSHVVHPDLPLFYLGALALKFVGRDLSLAPAWVDIHLGLAAVLTCLALWWLARALRPGLPPVLIAAGLGLLLWCPSLLRYLQLYAAESFNLALGLPALTLFWLACRLDQPPQKTILLLAGCGALLGLCVAVKLTYLMYVVGFGAGAFIRVMGLPLGLGRRLLALAGLAASILAPALAFMAPVLGALLPVLGEAKGVAPHWPLNLEKLRQLYPPLFWVTALGAIACLAHLARGLWRALRRPARPAQASAGQAEPADPLWERDWPALSAMLLAGAGGMLYALMLVTTSHWDLSHPQHLLRYISPYVICAPFCLAAIHSWLSRWRPLDRALRWPPLEGLAALAILALVLAGTWDYAAYRRDFLDKFAAQNQADLAGLTQATKDFQGPWVIWDDSSSVLFGLPSFHLWGNYMFAANAYDAQLRQAYPHLRWLHLRSLAPSIRAGRLRPEPTADLGVSISAPYRHRRADRVADSQEQLQPPFVVIVRQDELQNEIRGEGGDLRPKLAAVLKDAYGAAVDPARWRRYGFGEHLWLILPVVAPAPAPAAAPTPPAE
ncbi:MAG: hypothetical protein ACOZHQ_14160 [Thermodesulfobacteriota bacterium]